MEPPSGMSTFGNVLGTKTSALFAIAAIATAIFPLDAYSQNRTRELRVERCSGCRLTKRVVASLGRPGDSVLVMPNSRVVRLGANRYLAAPVSVPGQLAIFKSDGTLERVVGREGGGPLEYSRYLGPIIESTPGTAIVVDRRNARLMLVDSLGKARPYGRTAAPVYGGAALPDGRLVVSAEFRTATQFGFPLHVIDRGGRIVRSFGASTRTVDPRDPPAIRVLASSRRAGVWFSPNDRYELSFADSAGRITTVLTRPFASRPPGPSGMLTFSVASIHEDNSGRMWVVCGHRRNVPSLPSEAPINPGSLKVMAAGLTFTIDIVDPIGGTVIYEETFDGPPMPMIGDGLAYRYIEDADGNPRIDVVALQLSRRT